MPIQAESTLVPHSFFEDCVAIVLASIFISLGILFFKEVNLLSGGVTGIALFVHNLTGIAFGKLLIVFNAPFFVLAYFKSSKIIAAKSLLCSLMVSVVTDNLGTVIQLQHIDPYYAAIAGGFLFGMGLLALIRHESSLGGFTILALVLREKFRLNVGRTQLFIDTLVLSLSLVSASFEIFLLSLLGVGSLNLVIALYHKKGRYRGVG